MNSPSLRQGGASTSRSKVAMPRLSRYNSTGLSVIRFGLPRTNSGLALTGLLAVFWVFYFLGDIQAKVGTVTCPPVASWWLVISGAGAFMLVPKSGSRFPVFYWMVMALGLAVTSGSTYKEFKRLTQPSPVRAFVYRPSKRSDPHCGYGKIGRDGKGIPSH